MIIAGYFMWKHCPGKVNSIVGYRTKRSMVNFDTWKFANENCGRRWWRTGWILFTLTILAQLPFYGKNDADIGTLGLIICVVESCILIISIYPTEIALKRTFNEDGSRKQTDVNAFIIDMMERLEEKTRYGADLSVLSGPERIFYVTQTLEMEVNNGGFSQFFYNSSRQFSNELVSSFTAIEATATAKICQRAVLAVEEVSFDDENGREEELDKLLDDETVSKVLVACDDAFYKREENLNELNYSFVMRNKESFSTFTQV